MPLLPLSIHCSWCVNLYPMQWMLYGCHLSLERTPLSRISLIMWDNRKLKSAAYKGPLRVSTSASPFYTFPTIISFPFLFPPPGIAGKTVIVSNQPYFYKKAELFPGSAFVIGADTVARLINVSVWLLSLLLVVESIQGSLSGVNAFRGIFNFYSPSTMMGVTIRWWRFLLNARPQDAHFSWEAVT